MAIYEISEEPITTQLELIAIKIGDLINNSDSYSENSKLTSIGIIKRELGLMYKLELIPEYTLNYYLDMLKEIK